MSCHNYNRFIKFLKTFLFIVSGLVFYPFVINAQSFTTNQRFYEGRYYLAAESYSFIKNKSQYFAVDMEKANQLPDTVFARQLFKSQLGTEGPMKDFISDTAKSKQKYKLIKLRDKQPGSLFYRDIKAFDEILDRDEDRLKKKKKEDKKNNVFNQYYVPSELIAFHEASERYFLFSTFGIYAVHQDSLQLPAKTIIEYTGFRFKGIVSAKFFNPHIYIIEFVLGNDKIFYKVFDMKNGTFDNIPGLDEISMINCWYSRSSPHVIFSGNSNDRNDFYQRTILFNYQTLKVESDIRFTIPFGAQSRNLYLHKNLLYVNYSYFLSGWQDGLNVYDLKNSGKVVYSFKMK